MKKQWYHWLVRAAALVMALCLAAPCDALVIRDKKIITPYGNPRQNMVNPVIADPASPTVNTEGAPAPDVPSGQPSQPAASGQPDNPNKPDSNDPNHVHSYDTVTYEWGSAAGFGDFSTCTAVKACACGDTQRVKGKVTKKIISRVTCTEKGKIESTAVFDDPTLDTQIQFENDALGHKWVVKYTITTSAELKSGKKVIIKATAACEKCKTKVTETVSGTVLTNGKANRTHGATITVQAKFTKEPFGKGTARKYQVMVPTAHKYTSCTVNATCTKAGKKYSECVICKGIRNKKTLPALGHNYVNGRCTRCGAQDSGISLGN